MKNWFSGAGIGNCITISIKYCGGRDDGVANANGATDIVIFAVIVAQRIENRWLYSFISKDSICFVCVFLLCISTVIYLRLAQRRKKKLCCVKNISSLGWLACWRISTWKIFFRSKIKFLMNCIATCVNCMLLFSMHQSATVVALLCVL